MNVCRLIIGNFGLNREQERTNMAIWALLASPLLMSNDLRSISLQSRSILLNSHVIAINQDRLGRAGRVVKYLAKESVQVWARPLSPAGTFAIAVFNSRATEQAVSLSLEELRAALTELGIDLRTEPKSQSKAVDTDRVSYRVTEAFENRLFGVFALRARISLTVKAFDTFVARVAPSEPTDRETDAHLQPPERPEPESQQGQQPHQQAPSSSRRRELRQMERLPSDSLAVTDGESSLTRLFILFYAAVALFVFALCCRSSLRNRLLALCSFSEGVRSWRLGLQKGPLAGSRGRSPHSTRSA